MERIEMVEKIRERANISMEEARDVLERNHWDMLDAMVELERAGKINAGANASSKSNTETVYETVNPTFSGKEQKDPEKRMKFRLKEAIRTTLRFIFDNKLLVSKNNEEIIRVPLILPVIFALASVGTFMVVLLAGMVFGFRYTIEGKADDHADVTGKINETMDKAGEYTRNVVNSFAERTQDVNTEKDDNITEEKKDAGF